MCGIEPVGQKSGRRNRHNVNETFKSPHFRAYSDILVGLSGVPQSDLFSLDSTHVRLTTLLQKSKYVLPPMTNAISASTSLESEAKTTITPYPPPVFIQYLP